MVPKLFSTFAPGPIPDIPDSRIVTDPLVLAVTEVLNHTLGGPLGDQLLGLSQVEPSEPIQVYVRVPPQAPDAAQRTNKMTIQRFIATSDAVVVGGCNEALDRHF